MKVCMMPAGICPLGLFQRFE